VESPTRAGLRWWRLVRRSTEQRRSADAHAVDRTPDPG
jgi:hypothetical protein